MGDATKIEWTHHTFNPWIGCTKVSPGCKHCYAEALTRRSPALVHGQSGAAVVGLPVWGDAAPRRVTSAANWRQPLRWNAAAKKAGERRRVFCASLADVFEEREGLESARARLWALIEQTPHLDWLLLTKRPMWVLPSVPWRWWRTNPGTGGTLLRRRDNYCVFCDKLGVHTEDRGEGEVHHRCATRVYGWPRNVWIGCTVEDQQRAEERLPHLLKIPAPVRFVSYEPALAAVDFRPWLPRWVETPEGPSRRRHDGGPMGEGGCIDWLIVGGESGPGARPFDLAWARAAARQCKAAGVPVFMKQLGAAASDPPNGLAGRSLKVPPDAVELISQRLRDPKGGDPAEWPADLRVREWPAVAGR